MKTIKLEEFTIVGISVRTTNENGQAATDIGNLWNTFMTEGVLNKIPNKIDNTIYSVYTDYESDYTKPYTTILGCKVSEIGEIPKEMVIKKIKSSAYKQFIAKGDLTKGVVYETWTEIWKTALNRKYTADLEIYGENAQNPADSEVEILIAVE